MRQHIRVDSIKVFEEEEKILNSIIEVEKLKNKSEAWRKALEIYVKFSSSAKELSDLQRQVKENNELIKSLYFKLDKGE